MREDLVVDDPLCKAVNHKGQIVQETDANRPVWVGKETEDNRRDPGFEVVVRQLGGNLHDDTERLGPTAAKLDRLEQLGQHLHLEEILGEVVGQAVEITVMLLAGTHNALHGLYAKNTLEELVALVLRLDTKVLDAARQLDQR